MYGETGRSGTIIYDPRQTNIHKSVVCFPSKFTVQVHLLYTLLYGLDMNMVCLNAIYNEHGRIIMLYVTYSEGCDKIDFYY